MVGRSLIETTSWALNFLSEIVRHCSIYKFIVCLEFSSFSFFTSHHVLVFTLIQVTHFHYWIYQILFIQRKMHFHFYCAVNRSILIHAYIDSECQHFNTMATIFFPSQVARSINPMSFMPINDYLFLSPCLNGSLLTSHVQCSRI